MAAEGIYLQPSLLLELSRTDVHRHAWSSKQERVDRQVKVGELQVAAVKGVGVVGTTVVATILARAEFRCRPHVVIYLPALPVEPAYLIDGILQCQMGIFGYGLLHLGVHSHRVAGHVEGEGGLPDVEVADVYLPVGFALGGIFGYGVVEGDV